MKEKVKEIKESKSYNQVLQEGSLSAQQLANKKMTKVYKAIGIYPYE